jgi:hypothetical protein
MSLGIGLRLKMIPLLEMTEARKHTTGWRT